VHRRRLRCLRGGTAIGGLGFAEVFQRSHYQHGWLGLPAAEQKDVLDLLLDATAGGSPSPCRPRSGCRLLTRQRAGRRDKRDL
jgi:hypothetical protein